MKQIAQNLKGLYKEIILGPVFKLLEAVLELFVPLVMASIIDAGIANGDKAYVLRRGGLLLLLAVLGVAAALTCQYFAARAGSQFGARLRTALYKHVLSFSSDETALYGSGGLITRLTGDVNAIQAGLNMAIRLAVRVPFLVVGSIIMAMLINLKIGLVFLISTPLIILVLYFIMKRTIPRYTDIQAGQDSLSRLSRENLEGTRVIRAFSRQQDEERQFEAEADALSALLVRVGRISAALNPLTTFIVNIAILFIVWLGAGFVFSGSLEPGQIVALVTYMNQTLLALVVAANLVVLFTRAFASLKRVQQVFATQPSITDGPGAEGIPNTPAIEFSGVTFAYHKGADAALSDICFKAMPGQLVGVIGGTGSGKTTLVQLVQRMFDVQSGQVRVAGNNVKSYTLPQLRSRIGAVPQTAALVTGSVRHNLQIANPAASDELLWHALRVAQGAEFVEKLPDGLDTLIEEGGKNLSGGQKQRLTIARAVCRTPDILILDDSASALDYATDAALRRSLRAEMDARPGMLTLMVSQRAATIKGADVILVLDDGRLVGSGTHEQLLEANDVYREICASQGIELPGEGTA